MTFRIEIPAESSWFQGHFPGRPILPGIAQLAFVQRALGVPLSGVSGLKLRRPVLPGEVLDLLLEPAGGEGWTRFELRREGEAISSGSVLSGESEAESPPQDTSLGETAALPLLPHAPPARLVTGVIVASAGEIVCAAEVSPSHPLVEGDRFPSFLGIEAAAQAAAVLEALARHGEDRGPRTGYLVGVREASFAVPFLPVSQSFRVTARLQGSAPPLSIYEIAAAGVVIGTVSTFLAD